MSGRFERAGLALAFDAAGAGQPVLFQHGLGGNRAQVAEVFPDGFRRVTLECRGQGASERGPAEALSLATFADDVAALAEHLGIARAVVGGISMGAAIALRLAITRPGLVNGLILARPAWLFAPAPDSMQAYALVGELLANRAPQAAKDAFLKSPIAQVYRREALDNLASLLGFFDRPDAAEFAAVLKAIAADGPGVSEAEARRLSVPVLVIGHADDLVHPLSYAQWLAALIPGARFATITSKVKNRARYVAEFRAAIAGFLGDAAG